MAKQPLPHLDPQGRVWMVDIGDKPSTRRLAIAEAFVKMKPLTLARMQATALEKGDVFAVARIAGISAAKRTSDLIPLAHPIPLTHVAVEIEAVPENSGVRVEARVETTGRTGVEMEALTAAAAAALTIYDMAKKVDRAMSIERLQLLFKSGGQSGSFRRDDDAPRPKKKVQKRKKSKR